MTLTLELKTLFLETLNTSYIYPIISKVHFVKGLVNSILIYILNMIHICPYKMHATFILGIAVLVFGFIFCYCHCQHLYVLIFIYQH